jgi:tetratricopeptide (TPR) repeat protein
VRSLLAATAVALVMVPAPRAAAQAPVKGEVSVAVENGYVRLVFRMAEEVEAQVRLANNVLTITFQKPVNVSVDRVSANAADYVAAARRDPDGRAVRMALSRKVTMNSIAAGERLYVDLMPEGWVGLPPGLPREVIDELATRARDAEKKARQQRALTRQESTKPIRVRVVVQPRFTRYVFDLPALTIIDADNKKDMLTLTFDGALRFDLADAVATLPAAIKSIEGDSDHDSATVRFAFAGNVDVRTFREDNSYVVDVSPVAEQKIAQEEETPPEIAEPLTVPVRPADEAEAAAPPTADPGAAPQDPATPAPGQPAAAASAEPGGPVAATLTRSGDGIAIAFPFASPTPAAVFHRGDVLWLVFDSTAPISLAALEKEIGRSLKSASATRQRDATLVRLRLERPMLASAAPAGATWTITLGSEVVEPTRPLGLTRNIVGASRSSVTIAVDDPRDLHRIEDPEAGDTLLVATALAPARGFLKSHDFIEFRVLPSTHGVVMQPLADDLNVELAADKIVATRPTGLTLSAVQAATRGQALHVIEPQSWVSDRQADFLGRKSELMLAAAEAPEGRRLSARADLARFYLARDMAYEAKGVLDVALAESPPSADSAKEVVLRAACNIMIGRADAGLKDLANPFVGNLHDAPLWRALAFAKLGKWAEAREGFRNMEVVLGTLPLEVQRTMMKEMVRASIEVGDITSAAAQLHDLETIGIPRELEPAMAVLAGRINESLGRTDEARRAYQTAAESWERPSAAQGRLREIMLRQSLGQIERAEFIAELETLTAIWRGDATEVEALHMLARLYTQEGRYREAFQTMRIAISAHSTSEMARRIQEEAATTFDSLFLAGKGDALPAIDALALFYDFRELTPIGRRGDEMIRRLADRLVAVDLLYQASELLRHQVDHRLQGAARAQVAARLAVTYLMDRKPDRALATLRATRAAELSNDLRNQRLLIEGRALSELGRHDVAIEVIANIPGREAIRLRSDVHWAAKRFSAAAEQIELLYGDRWKEFEPLNDAERLDILRGAIGYALGDDTLGLARFRERYAAKMGDGLDRRAFEVITEPVAPRGGEFREIARGLAAVDTLEGFLRDLRARYPETGARPTRPRLPAGRTAQAR